MTTQFSLQNGEEVWVGLGLKREKSGSTRRELGRILEKRKPLVLSHSCVRVWPAVCAGKELSCRLRTAHFAIATTRFPSPLVPSTRHSHLLLHPAAPTTTPRRSSRPAAFPRTLSSGRPPARAGRHGVHLGRGGVDRRGRRPPEERRRGNNARPEASPSPTPIDSPRTLRVGRGILPLLRFPPAAPRRAWLRRLRRGSIRGAARFQSLRISG